MYVTNTATPDWKPLEDVLADPRQEGQPDIYLLHGLTPADFMYMGTADAGIRLYKHRDTRKCLNIDAKGKFYAYKPAYGLPGDYVYIEITREQALKAVRP